MINNDVHALKEPLFAGSDGLQNGLVGTKSVLRIALLSTACIGEMGSMAAYSWLLHKSLNDYVPWLDVSFVRLREKPVRRRSSLGRHWSAIQEIRRARLIAGRTNADVFHLMDGSNGFMGWGVPLARTLVTVHDLIPALQAEGRFAMAPPGWMARQLIRSSLRFARQAALVCTVSSATAGDLFRLTGRQTDAVVHHATRPMPGPGTGDGSIPECGPLILHVGNNGFYKNRPGVLRVFAQMALSRQDLTLVLAGAAPDGALLGMVDELGLNASVHFIVEPNDAALATLYARASLLLFPSFYEGFGWPPLEAMTYGCPVVCSNTGSLPEVVGNAAVIHDPGDIQGFAAAALRVLENQALARALVARGHQHVKQFSVQRMAMQYARLYRQIAASSAAGPRRVD